MCQTTWQSLEDAAGLRDDTCYARGTATKAQSKLAACAMDTVRTTLCADHQSMCYSKLWLALTWQCTARTASACHQQQLPFADALCSWLLQRAADTAKLAFQAQHPYKSPHLQAHAYQTCFRQHAHSNAETGTKGNAADHAHFTAVALPACSAARVNCTLTDKRCSKFWNRGAHAQRAQLHKPCERCMAHCSTRAARHTCV